ITGAIDFPHAARAQRGDNFVGAKLAGDVKHARILLQLAREGRTSFRRRTTVVSLRPARPIAACPRVSPRRLRLTAASPPVKRCAAGRTASCPLSERLASWLPARYCSPLRPGHAAGSPPRGP